MRILKRLVLPFWAVILGSCAPRAYVPVVIMPISPLVGGVTVCDRENNPVIILNQLHYNPLTSKYTEAHEWKHIEQVRAFGDCRKFMRKYTDEKLFALQIEGEAYCTAFKQTMADGVDSDYDSLVKQLMEMFGFSKSETEKYTPCKPSG